MEGTISRESYGAGGLESLTLKVDNPFAKPAGPSGVKTVNMNHSRGSMEGKPRTNVMSQIQRRPQQTAVGVMYNRRNKSNTNKTQATPSQVSKRSVITGWGPSQQMPDSVAAQEDPNHHIKIHDEVDDAVNIGESISPQDQATINQLRKLDQIKMCFNNFRDKMTKTGNFKQNVT